MYRIHQIKLGLDEPKDKIPEKILKKIGGRDLFLKEWRIVKESLDARDKSAICWVYTVDFTAASRKDPKKKVYLPSGGKLKLEVPADMTYHLPKTGEDGKALSRRPVVVGMGPAGLFCGLILAQAGYRPVIIERGKDAERRSRDVEKFWNEGILDEESNVQFGEGGAGTFSDGKLTTGIKDPRIRKVFEELVQAGAPAEILYRQRPHIGTDLLRRIVKQIRSEILRLGGEVRFDTKLEDLLFDRTGTGLRGISIRNRDTGLCEELECQVLVLAVGHSARDTFRMLQKREIAMTRKPFSIGFRIEHRQEVIDRAQYGAPASALGLPPAEYKLHYKWEEKGAGQGRGVYTFCMCPGGKVIGAASQAGGVVVNGMSYHDRNSGFANSALLCDVRVTDFDGDDVLAGVDFQEKYERLAFQMGGGHYRIPTATWAAFQEGSAPQLENCLPPFAAAAFREAMPVLGRKLKGFDAPEAKLYGVETRSSSPVRIIRGDTGEGRLTSMAEEQRLEGFYPCGEGAGYAGGITSAAVDGIRTAEKILSDWIPHYGK